MKTLFLDIETCPSLAYVWGAHDQYVAVNQIAEPGSTICWAASWDGSREVMFDSVHQSSQRRMVRGVYNLINEADIIVHFNGKRFDVPTLNREFLLNGLSPTSPVRQVDLYQGIKGRFKFVSNSLSFICQQLGIGNKVHHKGMELWTGCMAGDDASWRVMERYNKQDVRLLKKLHDRVKSWLPSYPNAALYVKDEEPVCPRCGSSHLQRRGEVTLEAGVYQRYQCQECGYWPRGATNLLSATKRKSLLRPARG